MRKSNRKIKNETLAKKYRRKLSIRKTVVGTSEKPRMCVIKTNKNLQVQVVDDSIGKTLFSVQTFGKNGVQVKANKDGAKSLGEAAAAKLKEQGLSSVVFDRNGNKYIGNISVIADTVREAGIKI